LLKETVSRCPVCFARCPAEVWKTTGPKEQVFLERTCPEHGKASVCIASDARFYWLAKGDPDREGCGCGGGACSASAQGLPGVLGRNASGRQEGPFEKLATCLALIELVHSCNLSCPTCYADSPLKGPKHVDAVPMEDLQRRIQGVIDRKGGIELLQLSGGEPTLHPRFFEFIRWAQEHPKIDYLLLNTNGVRLATDPEFCAELARTFEYGGMQVYLQFDGTQEAEQKRLRGADLRELKKRALDACARINLPVTLAMTVTDGNLPHLWEAVAFGLEYPNVRGISFQPMFGSGRQPCGGKPDAAQPIQAADIIVNVVEQSAGKLRYADFTPLPCGDPNCATIGYLLRVAGQIHSISDFIDFATVQGFLQNKIRYKLEDLQQCGCESEPLGDLLKQFEMDERNTFRLFIKPFMDAGTWDEDRIDRCCTHVIRPDGKLDSFCRYYSGFADTRPAPL
jgi:uncharacterized radical SAM superfamily Fe-S cluster-containing enzyme